MNEANYSGASAGNSLMNHQANTSDDESMVASLQARISAAFAMASDLADTDSPSHSPSRLLDQDRRDRVERFSDRQLGMLSRLCRELQAGEAPPAEQVHRRFMLSFSKAKSAGYAADWEPVAYPLAVTIDECLLEMSWPGQRWWEDHVLESTLFGTRVGSQRFFELANQLRLERSHPAGPSLLRVYHECVAIGFRGLYATATPAALAEPLGLPPSLSQWRIEFYRAMSQWARETASPPRPDVSRSRTIPGAPPLRYQNSTWVLGGACLLLIAMNALIWSGMGR